MNIPVNNMDNSMIHSFLPLCSVKILEETICRPSFVGLGLYFAVLVEWDPTDTFRSFVFCAPMA